MPWRYDPRALRYRDGETGRFLAGGRAAELANAAIEAGQEVTQVMANMVTDGRLSPADWRERMRREIKDAYVQQYMLGRGGRAQMTQADWGSVGGSLSEQYRHLDRKANNFYGQVQTGDMSADAIAARSRMYMNSAREAYERGQARRLRGSVYDEVRWTLNDAEHCEDCVALAGRGWVEIGTLPTVPGAGHTACLCITSPFARVLTAGGWLPLCDVRPGDYVLTHRMRWRPVTALVIKPSRAYHRQVYLTGSTGGVVGATHDHLWWSGEEFTEVSNSDSLAYLAYNTPGTTGGDYAKEILSELRGADAFRQQARRMQRVPVRMSMREAKGFSRRAMPELQQLQEDDGTMVFYGRQDAQGPARSGRAAADALRGFDACALPMEETGRRSPLRAPLGGRQEAIHLPLPMGVATGERADPGGVRDTSYQSRSDRRPSGEFAAYAGGGACSASWQDESGRLRGGLPALWQDVCLQDPETLGEWKEPGEEVLFERMPVGGDEAGAKALPYLRQDVLRQPRSRAAQAVLFAEMLPRATALFDITVEEDHSFCIEGLFAHNTNCRCHLEYRRSDTGEQFEAEAEGVADAA